MPQRRGWAGALAGLGAGGEEGLQTIMAHKFAQDQQQREALFQIRKDLTDRVMADAVDPDVAEKSMASYGMPVPKGYFQNLRPSVADRMQKALAPVNAATSAANFPPQESVNLGLQAKGVNPIAGAGSPFTEAGSFDETNPEAASIFGAKRTALQMNEPFAEIGKGMTGVGENAAPTQTMGQFNPFPGTPGAGSYVNKIENIVGPTAGQSGAFEGSKAIAAAPGQITAQNQIEEGTRPAKIETERQTTATRLKEEYSPQMIALRTKLASQEENARLDAQAARINWESGRAETDSGLPYLDLTKFSGIDQRLAAEAAGKNHIPVLDRQDVDVVKNIDQAMSMIQQVAEIMPKLPSSITGVPLTRLMQSGQLDPQLQVLVALQPAALGIARTMGGPGGFRSSRMELEKSINAYLNADTAEAKAVQLSTIQRLLRNEEALHVLPKAQDRNLYIQSQIAPAQVPLAQGERAYRIGKQTMIFDANHNLVRTLTPKPIGQ